MAEELNRPPTPPIPPPALDTQPRRSGRHRQFPQLWRDFEATSYSPVTAIPQVTEQTFGERIEPHVEPALLTTPNMAQPSQNRLPLNGFRICCVFRSPPLVRGQDQLCKTVPPPHPFKNDSIFELMRTFILGPSSKTILGMDGIASAIRTGRVLPSELTGFKAASELHRLDDFAAKSPIAGGPWQVGSVKIKMPCKRGDNPQFSTEAEAPEFEVTGIRYRSLVDIMVSKAQDPSDFGKFVHQPFTEWWCPLGGGGRPIRIYGEAYSSDRCPYISCE